MKTGELQPSRRKPKFSSDAPIIMQQQCKAPYLSLLEQIRSRHAAVVELLDQSLHQAEQCAFEAASAECDSCGPTHACAAATELLHDYRDRLCTLATFIAETSCWQAVRAATACSERLCCQEPVSASADSQPGCLVQSMASAQASGAAENYDYPKNSNVDQSLPEESGSQGRELIVRDLLCAPEPGLLSLTSLCQPLGLEMEAPSDELGDGMQQFCAIEQSDVTQPMELPPGAACLMLRSPFIKHHQVLAIDVVDVGTPSFFWLRLLPCFRERMMAKMNEHFAKDKPEPLTKPPFRGDLVCCINSSGVWHRALVTQHDPTSFQTEVLYVDYGKVITTSTSRLAVLDKNLLIDETVVIPCSLGALLPCDPEGKWQPSAIELFKSLLLDGSSGSSSPMAGLHAVFNVVAGLPIAVVDLTDKSGTSAGISELLISRGLARHGSPAEFSTWLVRHHGAAFVGALTPLLPLMAKSVEVAAPIGSLPLEEPDTMLADDGMDLQGRQAGSLVTNGVTDPGQHQETSGQQQLSDDLSSAMDGSTSTGRGWDPQPCRGSRQTPNSSCIHCNKDMRGQDCTHDDEFLVLSAAARTAAQHSEKEVCQSAQLNGQQPEALETAVLSRTAGEEVDKELIMTSSVGQCDFVTGVQSVVPCESAARLSTTWHAAASTRVEQSHGESVHAKVDRDAQSDLPASDSKGDLAADVGCSFAAGVSYEDRAGDGSTACGPERLSRRTTSTSGESDLDSFGDCCNVATAVVSYDGDCNVSSDDGGSDADAAHDVTSGGTSDCYERQSFRIVPSHVVSPSEFYVHLVTKEAHDAMQQLEGLSKYYAETIHESMLARYLGGSTQSLGSRLQVGDVVCATYGNYNAFYRARVEDVLEQRDNRSDELPDVYVYFIDYGNREWVRSFDQVMPLRPQYADILPQAICCRLAGLKPTDDGVGSSRWSKEAICDMQKLVGIDRSYLACFLEPLDRLAIGCREGTSLEDPVPVLLAAADSSSFIVDALLSLGHVQLAAASAALIDEVTTHASPEGSSNSTAPEEIAANELGSDPDYWRTNADEKTSLASSLGDPDTESLDNWDPMARDYRALTNSYKVDPDDPEFINKGYSSKQRKNICKFFETKGHCYRGDRCHFEHVRMRRGAVTEDVEELYFVNDIIEVPANGNWTCAEVSCIVNPNRFYLVFPFGGLPVGDLLQSKHSDGGSLDESSMAESLVALQKGLNQRFTSKSGQPLKNHHASAVDYAKGELVVAMFSRDNLWYRATIVETDLDREVATVYFVDFGNEDRVSMANIRPIEPQFIHLSFQAVEASLVIEPAKREFTEAAIDDFIGLVKGKLLFAHILHRYGPGKIDVELCEASPTGDLFVSKALVDRGHARALGRQPATVSGTVAGRGRKVASVASMGKAMQEGSKATGLVVHVPG